VQTPTALLGLGIMGSRLAARLLGAGVPLAVWNRDPAKTAALVGEGATVAESPAGAVAGRRFAVLALADGAAVEEVLWERGAAAALDRGSIVIDISSIPAPAARRHAERLAERGVAYLDAPVSGGSRGAEAGELTIMVGGDRGAFREAGPLLAPLGRATHLGASGAGQVAKAANQMIVGVTIAAVAEAFTLAEAAGVSAERVREALLGGFADSRILREHGRRMIEDDFTPGARVATQVKDLRTAEALADEVGAQTPVAAAATELFVAHLERVGPDLDHASVVAELRRRARGRPAGP
jgi:2-hydroxy-3-oxopropionate reductase